LSQAAPRSTLRFGVVTFLVSRFPFTSSTSLPHSFILSSGAVHFGADHS